MAYNILELLIKMGVVGREDVQAANELLAETGKATTETAKATVDLGAANESGSEKAEEAEISHRALHQILHLIAHESGPEAGAAVAAIGAAGGGGILIGIMAAKELFEWLGKLREGAEKLNETMATMDVSRWDAQAEAANAAAESAFRFRQEIELGGKAVDVVTEKYKLQAAQIAAIQKTNSEILEQMERMELAAAKSRDATPAEIDAIHQRYEAQKSASKVADEALAVDQKTTEQNERIANAPKLEAKAAQDDDRKKAAIGDKSAAADKSSLEILNGNREALLTEAFNASGTFYNKNDITRGAQDPSEVIGKIQSSIDKMKDEASKMPSNQVNGVEQNGALVSLQVGIKNAEEKLGEFTKNADRIDALNKSVQAHNELVETLTKQADKSAKAFSDNRDTITDLSAAIKTLQALLEIDKQGAGVKGRLNDFEHAQTIADDFTKNGKTDNNSAAFIITLTQAITGQKQTFESAVKVVESMAPYMNRTISVLENHAAQISAVQARLERLEQHPPGR